jgi:hypothetical protein
LYNLTRAIRACVAGAGKRPVSEVSGEKVFRDVRRELIGWRTVLSAEETLSYFEAAPVAEEVRRRLGEVLGRLWRDDWVKARPKKRVAPHPTLPYRRGAHSSVQRVLSQSKHART